MEILKEIVNWLINETNIYVKAISLPLILGVIYKFIKFIIQKLQIHKDRKNLFPFYDNGVIKRARKDYVRTKCQNINPSDEINIKSTFAFSAKEDLLNFFLKKVFKQKEGLNQFYLILGDSGMGKTTFSLNLFSRYNSIFNLFYKSRNIKLLPLGIDLTTLKQSLNNIKEPNKTILILDGFDEAPNIKYNEIQNEFDKLIDLVKLFKIVIITCRTHYFSSQKEEPNELKVKRFNTSGNGFHSIKKMYVSPFDSKDIKNYINKTFNILQFKQKRKAFEIVNDTDDLLARPMLLSYIKDLVNNEKKSFESRTEIYETLILSWLERESNKYPDKERAIFKSNLSYFSYELVKFIYENYEKNGLYIPFDEVEKLSDEFNIDLNKIELKSRSLLNRNSEGKYKFSHKSIFEFLLAYLTYITRDADKSFMSKLKDKKALSSSRNIIKIDFELQKFDQAKFFFEEMVITGKLDFKLPEVIERYGELDKNLIRRILKEKSKLDKKSNKKLIWLTGKSYELK